MITTPTVLILGAGASLPFGYPTGQALVYQVLNVIKGRADFLQNELQIPFECLEEFDNAFSTCGLSSIDEFLEYRTDLIDLGRVLIALCLIPQEDPRILWAETTDKKNWYKKHLFPAMKTPSLGAFGDNKLSVLTYNYDRSLEHFLLQSLMSTYRHTGDDPAPCWVQLKKIPIVHLHGQLDDLHQRPYSKTLTPEIIKQSAPHIKIIHENIADDPQFTQAHDLLRKAERVYFLGFGYHPVNLERLCLDVLQIRNVASVQGTALNFGRIALDDLKTRTNGQINLIGTDIMNFLRQHVPLT